MIKKEENLSVRISRLEFIIMLLLNLLNSIDKVPKKLIKQIEDMMSKDL